MGCPFHDSGTDEGQGDGDGGGRGIDRREFVKAALAIGGTGALASLGEFAGVTGTASAAGEGRIDARARANRQHAWDAFEPTVASGNSLHPAHSVILLLDYAKDGEPAPGHRRRVERALRGIEDHYEWRPRGVMFTMAYSAAYFDRFEDDPPPGAAPDDQETVAATVESLTDLADTNDDVTPDEYDAALLLSSDNPANLLAVEEALWSNGDVDLGATFEGIFEKPDGWPDRRVGFGGPAFQKREEEFEDRFLTEGQEIPDKAPLSMGFIAGFGASIPEEEVVTLKRGQEFPSPDVDADSVPDLGYVGEAGERDPGVFAQGTLKHLSHLTIDLPEWYGEDDAQRRHQMYSPFHSGEETNAKGGAKPGSALTDADAEDPNEVGPGLDSIGTLEYADRTPGTAAAEDEAALTDEPTVAHSQKTARARYDVDGDGDPEQPVLRRDWDGLMPAADGSGETNGYIFNVPMRFNESIYTLLDATYNVGFTSLDGGVDHAPVDDDVADTLKERNGIAPYMTATRRGNWLVPPITMRSLPHPRADEVDLSVQDQGDSYLVEVAAIDRVVDFGTVRFGRADRVDRAGGARPTDIWAGRGALHVRVPKEDVEAATGDTVEFFVRHRGTRKPVVGLTTL